MKTKPAKKVLRNISVDRVYPNPMQPRQIFDEVELQELADSIREHGVIEPIVVEICGRDFILHDGERRWRAARIAELKKIPAIVHPPLNGTGPRERLERALVANVQRADMHPIEEGMAYQRLIDEFGFSVHDIKKSTGKAVSRIYQCMELLAFEPEIRELMLARKLPVGDGRAVTALKSIPAGEERIKLATALAQRNATANMVRVSCQRYLLAKGKLNQKKKKGSPAIALVQNKPNEWDALYQINRVPPWPVITDATMATCDVCPMKSIANDFICRDCGLVIALQRMMEMAHVHKS